jgi:hypothetical protein
MTAGVLGMFRFAVFTNKVYDHVPKKSNRNRGSGGRLVFGDVRNSYLKVRRRWALTIEEVATIVWPFGDQVGVRDGGWSRW